MNCEPGDIAMVVRNTTGIECVSHMVGTPIEVEILLPSAAGPAWTFKGPPLRCPTCGNCFIGFLDADLQPLRPGREKADTSGSQPVRSGEVAHG